MRAETTVDGKTLIAIVDVDTLVRNWWVVVLRGVAGIIFGLITFFAPGISLAALVLVFGAYTFIGVWQFQESCANATTLTNPGACYEVRDPLDLAVVASALMGACLGFLWWNTSPAKIFMGDTGSLALGGVLTGLAILSRTELLVAIMGGLFVLITMSVVIQVGSFRLTGKRVFRMAPLQHHFELKGWSEVLVVVRFWIIQGICVIVGLGLFYAGWAAKK